MPTIFGSGIKRREDPRLITGTATYTDDVKLTGLTYAAFLRSPYGPCPDHPQSTRRPPSGPPACSRVHRRCRKRDRVAPVPCAWNVPNCDLKVPPHPLLAHDKVRYVGDGVAMVIAETRATARDAIDLIDVDYEPLGGGVDPEKMAQPGRRSCTPKFPTTSPSPGWWLVAMRRRHFNEAEVRVKERIVQQRLLPTAMGMPRRGGKLQQGIGSADPLGDQPEPAHSSLPLFGYAEPAGASDTGYIARGGRRIRKQDPAYPDEALVSLRRWTSDVR